MLDGAIARNIPVPTDLLGFDADKCVFWPERTGPSASIVLPACSACCCRSRGGLSGVFSGDLYLCVFGVSGCVRIQSACWWAAYDAPQFRALAQPSDGACCFTVVMY